MTSGGLGCFAQRTFAAFWAAVVRLAFETPFQRALPPPARLSSGHSWPHLGHLFIGFANLAERNNLGRFDCPIADEFDYDSVAVDLTQNKADILLAFLRLAVLHKVIYFHEVSMRASTDAVNMKYERLSILGTTSLRCANCRILRIFKPLH